ncbi:hypothetical protein U9M48_040738 [Paspalum notatum var. saurae]|uniref:Uncharacterized protein n=1 Tax=Paspalum notatum var. saurae TaxID=547442 RepID=A0AAQ3UNU3_PASNO
MQAQVNLNTEAVNQAIHDQQHLAAQVEAAEKVLSRMTLEQMAQGMEERSDTSSMVSEPHASPTHKAPPHKFEAALHLEGKAAQWYQVFKTQHKVNTWGKFVQAVLDKFGVYEHRHALNDLLDLKQSGIVEEYVDAFETLQYQVSLHNGHMGDLYFVAQFIRGLKPDLRFGVQAQAPETMERAIMLAKIQQELHDKNSVKSHKPNVGGKAVTTPAGKPEAKPVFNPALARERQLRDYRRAHGLCYYCGDRYDATHLEKCSKRPPAQAHALVVNELGGDLTDEVLTQLAMEDSLAADFGTRFLNALAGTETGCCLKSRALVNNKVMLILVDSGSSHSFVSTQFINQIDCQTTSVTPAKVKLANGEEIVRPTVEQLVKWSKGNDIWAYAMVQPVENQSTSSPPGDISSLLQEFADVFTTPIALPPHRSYDHTITLLPGSTPVNSKPYRYSPLHKDEIERQVKCLMNEIMEPFLRKFVLVFMDDILVYSSSLQQHVQHLRAVMLKLREHQFFLKPSKCSFAQPQIEYLGHIISQQGVAIDPSKTAAMQQWPVPTSATELRGFLGLTGYYRRFIKGYGLIARPLHNLLKKNAFQWSVQAQEAFVALKQAMQEAPVLALPDFQEVFVVESDACALGIGAVLMQHNRSLAFLSKALGAKQQHLSIYEKEFLALIMAVEKWRPYLQRNEFIIRTDHRSLAYLTEQNLHSEMQRKAMARLMGVVQPVWVQEVLNSYATDSHAQQLLTQLAIHSPDDNGHFRFQKELGLMLLWTSLRAFQNPESYDSILVVVDRDRIFLSTFWKELFHLLGTKLLSSTAYHPQTDGQSEQDWKNWLPIAELWYSSHHSSLGCSPFKALYGYDPTIGAIPDSQGLTSVASRPYPKLAFKYFGPYTIVERIGGAAYSLQLPPGSLIHPVFHVSQLKPFTPDYSPVFSDVSTFVPLDTADVSPEVILDRRLVKKGNQAITQVLIKWSNLPASSATWEDYDVLKTHFPASVAWGQATS